MKYNLTKLKSNLKSRIKTDAELLEIAKEGKIELDLSALNLDKKQEAAMLKKMLPKARKQISDDLSQSIPSMEDFERRGYEYGTIEQSWSALHRMAESIEQDGQVSPDVALWLLNALNRTKEGDPQDLLRNLGLVARGRSKVVNKYDVSDRMQALIDGGMVKEHAALQVAEEFGCSRATALHWHRKRGELFPDN